MIIILYHYDAINHKSIYTKNLNINLSLNDLRNEQIT